jgi:hypothetical protein
MDTLFALLKKSLVAVMFVVFATAATYVPQPNTPIAHAGAAAGGATVFQQLIDGIQQVYTGIASAASAAYDAVAGYIDGLTWQKDWLLDGLAWTVAKAIIGAMVQDLVSWINSGFEGAPMFITDTGAFLTDIGDNLAGEYINSLGGLGSFVCSPFQLDVQLAVGLHYQETRGGEETEACSLSDIQGNLGNFIDGTQRSFENGGWQNWLEVTSKPEDYTPYGSTLKAVGEFNARLVNKQGEEINLIHDGFLSQKTCTETATPNGPVEDCSVSTPGSVISDALSKGVDSDRESLVQADEVNEIFAAIIGQLGKAAFSEASSLISGF